MPGTDADRLVYLYAHIPKTGGRTVVRHAKKHMTGFGEFVHLSRAANNAAIREGRVPFRRRPPEERGRARLVIGHQVRWDTGQWVPGREARFVTFLRDPVARLVSRYNHQMHRRERKGEVSLSFARWYEENDVRNSQLGWLASQFMGIGVTDADAAKKRGRDLHPPPWCSLPATRPLAAGDLLPVVNRMLEQFFFVSCTEFIDRDAPRLFRELGLPSTLRRLNVGDVDYPKRQPLTDALRHQFELDFPEDVELYQTWRDRACALTLEERFAREPTRVSQDASKRAPAAERPG